VPKVSDEHKAEVRQRLLDAARTCLERNGYQDVTTRELLAEAGLSTGTFYNYFPTKSALYEALAESMLGDDLVRLAERAGGGGGRAGQAIVDFIRNDLVAAGEAATGVAAFRSSASGEDTLAAIRTLNRWIVEGFTRLVEEAQAEGTIRDDIDAAAFVELLDIIWDGIGRRRAQASLQSERDRIADVLVAVLTGGAVRAPVPG
jgi:AcrR family transcriptional regulator